MEKRITNESTASYSAKAIKKLPFIAVAASLIFLFNANVNIIDILPDFIGYIILSIALVKFGDLNSEIEASARFFRYMICVDLSKYAALMWVFGTTKSDMQNNAILLVAFVYAVIEVILLTIAFKKLFEGLAALGYTNQNTSILGSARAGGRTNTDKIRGFTFFFIVAKAAFSVLPEFAVLTTVEYTENSFVMYLYEYIGIMRLLAFFFGTIIGIVWIIGIFRYFKRIASDKVFVDSLILRYNTEIISKDGIFVRRNTEIASLIYIFALVFMFDLKFESVNIIPDFIAAILCLFGIVSFIRVSRSKCYFLALPAVIYAITSIIAQYVEIGFFDKYYYGAVFRAPEVYNAYVKMCVFSTVSVVSCALTFVSLIIVLCKIVDVHTGVGFGLNDEREAARLFESRKENKKKLFPLLIGALISVACDIFCVFGAISYGFADEVSIVGNIILLFCAIKTFGNLKDDIKAKYILE